MDRLTGARHRLAGTTDLPAVLDVAYDAFEDLLAVLRHHQEDDEVAFPAFVLAAAAAANGRDWIAGADGLPPAMPRERENAADPTVCVPVADVARIASALASDLATRLTAVAASAGGAGDQQCCQGAAAEARTMLALLSGASPP